MIKWIHENKRSITVFLVASVVVLSMSFFGINIRNSKHERYAIKIGDETISFEEFQKEKKDRQEMMVQQYKKILGANFSKFADQIYNMPNQEIADNIIEKRLAMQEAKRLNLYVGEEQLEGFIKNQVFGGNFNPATYAAYLSQTGQTARGFENTLKTELLIDNYKNLLSDMAAPSKREVENFIKAKETAYDVNYIEFDPKNYEDKVTVSDADLEKYYTSNQTDFEIPAKVQYNYSLLNPQNSMNLVEISADDIAFEYSDNESRYMTKEQAKVKQIQINIPKDADKAKQEEIKNKAEEAHSKASAGENFDLLVPQYSDDMLTAAKNGDLGWVEKGKLEKKIETAIFSLKGKGVPDLISTDQAYYIIKVEDYKAPELKKLEDVKPDIEAELRKREAPAFISAKAHEIFDVWEKGQKNLKDITSENKFTYTPGDKLLDQGTDPVPLLKGLTKTVLETPSLPKQIIDLGDNTILVEVVKYEESKIPSFAEAKETALKNYKKEKSSALAKEAAQKFADNLKAQDKPDLKAAAKTENLKVEEKKGLSKAAPDSGIFSNKDLQESVFNTSQVSGKPAGPVSVQGKYYLLVVNAITPPDAKVIQEKYKTYEEQAFADSAKALFQANLNRLKAKAEIDIDKNLLAQGSNV